MQVPKNAKTNLVTRFNHRAHLYLKCGQARADTGHCVKCLKKTKWEPEKDAK